MNKFLFFVTALFISQMAFSQKYTISIPNKTKEIYTGHLNLGGSTPAGNKISFNSFYMEKDGKPFIPIMGEIHYSRLPHQYWEEQILKAKAGGINVIATYVFWCMHETEENIFDWTGDKRLTQVLASLPKARYVYIGSYRTFLSWRNQKRWTTRLDLRSPVRGTLQ